MASAISLRLFGAAADDETKMDVEAAEVALGKYCRGAYSDVVYHFNTGF